MHAEKLTPRLTRKGARPEGFPAAGASLAVVLEVEDICAVRRQGMSVQ